MGKIVQSRKVDDATPDFYVQEESNGVGEVIRAFTADGQQKWRWPTDGRAIAMAAADNNGGVLAFNAFPTDTQTYLSSVSKDGVQLWRTATPKAIFSKYAVHPDGTVFYLQVTTSPVTAAQVIALNPTTGQPKFSVSLPESTTTTTGIRDLYQNPITGQFYTICDPANSVTTQEVGRFGGLVIDGDGRLWVPAVANVTNKSVTCTPQFDGDNNPYPWDGSGTSYSYTSTVYLVSVTSAGASSTAQLDSSGGSGTSWNDPMPRFNLRNAIIPDGAGGVLVSVVKPDLSNPIYRSTGVQYNTGLSSVDEMLLGENDTVFAAGSFGGVAALSLQTASLLWQRFDAVQLTAALQADSVLVTSGTLQKIDSTGAISDLAGGTPASEWSYFENDWWAAARDTGALGMAKGAAKKIVESLFPVRRGNREGQQTRSLTLGLFWCGTGPTGQGPCGQVGGADVQFSYVADPHQSASDPNNTNLNMLQDFSTAHPAWVGIIKSEAMNSLRKAFAQYAIDVRHASLVGSNLESDLDHTAYVIGDWPGDTGPVGETPQAQLKTSKVYYLKIMGNAQDALSQYEPTFVAFQPIYPPTDAQGESDFRKLATAIGRAIGNVAAHEFGHQLVVPKPDCGHDSEQPSTPPCDDNYDYVHNFFSGSGAPYTPPDGAGGQFKYVDVPGVPPIRWSKSACEKLKLVGGNTSITCP